MSRIPAPPRLEPNNAHVWMFSTDVSAEECAEFRNLLSKDECARADRFVFESDRIRFIASHGVMRTRLGSYCGMRPEAVVFGAGSHGKPFLVESPIPIQFNLSHSGTRGALVVTPDIRCGVDIEKVRPGASDQVIAERFFCAKENEWLLTLPADQRIGGFFRLWSVKESILKADGKGLSIPLSNIDTSDVVNRISFNVSVPNGNRALSLWVGELTVDEGYTSALAVEGDPPKVRILQGGV